MIKNFFLSKLPYKLLLISIVFSVFGCKTNKFKIDVSEIDASTQVLRFDEDVFGLDSINQSDFNQLQANYSSFFTLFNQRLNPMPPKDDTVGILKLNRYLQETDFQYLKERCDSVYPNFDAYEKELQKFWKHYKYYFPNKIIPDVVTYVGDFSYNIVALDSVIGVALNMYLGADWEPYKSLQIEQYRVKKMRPDRIVFDVAKGWYTSEYSETDMSKDFISSMLYNGKLLYYMEAMFPDAKDYEKIGYTLEQFQWMQQNEGAVWAFFLENDLLYKTQFTEYMKFIHDGNSTSGFPAEAPAQMGSYIGWQIVRAYMENDSEVTLAQLAMETDINKILSKANYKPKK